MKLSIFRTTVSALVLLFAAGVAVAHSRKEATQPQDGAILDSPPEAIAMLFDMPMRVTMISLTGKDGTVYDLVRSDNMQPVTEFSAAPAMLPLGHYRVEWRGLAADGHPMQGSFSFEVVD